MSRLLLVWLVIGSAPLMCVVARASDAPLEPRDEAASALERARVCWAALDPECAEAALTTAREQLADLAPEAQIEVLRMSAEVALSTERSGDAHTHLLALLERDPGFAPTGWPGPWRDALARANREAPDRLPPELEVTLPSEARPKRPIAVEVRATDRGGPGGPGGIARCELVLADGTRIALMSADGIVFRGEVPRELVREPELVIKVVAADRAGNAATWPARGGQRVAVTLAPEPPSPTITSRWWFWTALGVVVVGGVVGLALALDDGGGDAATLYPEGTLRVIPEFQ